VTGCVVQTFPGITLPENDMRRELRILVEGGKFFEDPRWRDGRWWVSDFYRRAVYTIIPGGHCEKLLDVEQQPSGLGWMPDGSMLIVSMRDHRVLRRSPEGKVSVHADLSPHCGGWANDMVVDKNGRAFVGNFGHDLTGGEPAAPAKSVRVDPDGRVEVAAEHLFFPNGSVITPDGRTLIVGETDEHDPASVRRPDRPLAGRGRRSAPIKCEPGAHAASEIMQPDVSPWRKRACHPSICYKTGARMIPARVPSGDSDNDACGPASPAVPNSFP
jgi:sugar lactone lactonase YvrE